MSFQDDPFRDYVRQRLQQRLTEMGAEVTPEYLEQAIEVYSRPGSVLRKEYFEGKARQGQAEASDAQFGGSAYDVVKRTALDAAMGAARGITSPGRAVLHMLGDPGGKAENLEQTMSGLSGASLMGNRGLSENPVLGTIQSAIEPASEMGANAVTIGNQAFEGAGHLVTNLANKLPKSQVLRALSRTGEALPAGAGLGARAMNVARATPRAMTQGVIGSAMAAPDEMFAHGDPAQSLAYAAALAVPSALGAGRISVPRDVTATGPGTSRLRDAFHSVTDLFEAPKDPTAAAQPLNRVSTAPGPGAAVSPRRGAVKPGSPSPELKGGETVDWSTFAPEQRTQVEQIWQNAKTLQARAQLLKVEGEVLGAGGKKLDPRIIENVSKAKTPSELMGFLQRRLLKTAGVQVPKAAKGAAAAIEQPAPVVEQPALATDANQLTPEARAAEHAANQAPVGRRAATIPKRKDVLTTAKRLEDGAIDWDALTLAQQQALTKKGMFGTSYSGKLPGRKMAQIQQMLSNPQFESFYTALKRKAPTASAETPATDAPAEAGVATPVSATPVEVPFGKTSSRNKKGRLAIATPEIPEDAAAKAAALADMQAEGITPLDESAAQIKSAQAAKAPDAPAEASPIFSAGGWDALNRVKKLRHLTRYTGDDAASMPLSKLPYAQLPAPLRAKLQGDPELASDLTAARGAEGGEPPSGAPFRSEPQPGPRGGGVVRRPKGKRKS